MPQMIIANRLVDGVVVFLAPGEGWTPLIADGVLIDDETEAQRLLAAAKQLEARSPVIDPQVIQVKAEGGAVRPVEIRELIRAFGPTVRTDPGAKGALQRHRRGREAVFLVRLRAQRQPALL